MRLSPRFVFALAIAVLAAWALLETRGWGIKTALYPRVAAVPLLILAVAEGLLSLKGDDGETDESEPMDFAVTTAVPPDLASRRTVVTVVWIGGFFLGVLLLGFQTATPLFVFAYLKGEGKEGWLLSLALPVLAMLAFHGLFVNLLHLPLPAGLLWRALGR